MTLIGSLTAEYSADVKTDLLKCVWSDQVKSGQTKESLITVLLGTVNDVMEQWFPLAAHTTKHSSFRGPLQEFLTDPTICAALVNKILEMEIVNTVATSLNTVKAHCK